MREGIIFLLGMYAGLLFGFIVSRLKKWRENKRRETWMGMWSGQRVEFNTIPPLQPGDVVMNKEWWYTTSPPSTENKED